MFNAIYMSKFTPVVILFLLTFLQTEQIFAQISTDPLLPGRYAQARADIPVFFKEKYPDLDSLDSANGLAIFVSYAADTINLKELNLISFEDNIEEPDDEMKLDKAIEESQMKVYSSFPYKEDGWQFIEMKLPEGYEIFKLLIRGNKVKAEFGEFYTQGDEVVKLHRKEKLTASVIVPCKVKKLELSDKTLKGDQFIYGYCEAESETYYRMEYIMEEKLLLLKKSFKVYFKFKPSN